MPSGLPLALVCVSCIVFGQDQRSAWTDKNNSQMYASYLLRTTYYERGYMVAQVDVERNGEADVFVVNPGPVFQLRKVKIVGLPENIASEAMRNAPKTGEVYSAARISDWLAEIRKQLAEAIIVQRFSGQETQLDRADATATVTLLFK